MIQAYRETCATVIRRFGGHLAKYILLASPPRAGEGVNLYLFRLARALHPYRSADEIAEMLQAVTAGCGRIVTPKNTGIKLLAAIREIFQERGTDRISTKDLLGELIDRDGDEPWAACWQKDFNAENIKGPAAKLARLLKPFGIIPETIRESDGIWIILNTVYQMFRPPKTS